MRYVQDKYGNRLSALGFGCMRFSRRLGLTDMKATEEQILEAVNLGVNYFDTAYIYPGSEAALGEILEKNSLRDRVFIATKLPHYLIKTPGDAERLLPRSFPASAPTEWTFTSCICSPTPPPGTDSVLLA